MEDILQDKPKKFFFDMNVFDADVEEEELPEEPPPPTFSEEELGAAKQSAFAQGKQEGMQESKASRDEQVSQVLRKISQDAQLLFAAESEREKIYETESVKLALSVFEKLFPLYDEQHGFEELKQALTGVLQKQEGQSAIVIEVHPDLAEGVQSHIRTIAAAAGTGAFEVKANDQLNPGACRLSWEDGGAIRDARALAGEIADLMRDTLAARGINVHDGSDNNPHAETTREERSAENPPDENQKSGDA